jgi:hypothetical protein
VGRRPGLEGIVIDGVREPVAGQRPMPAVVESLTYDLTNAED